MRFQCAAKTDVGLKRKLNEDSILENSETGFWVVADGMGGHEAGDVASSTVTRELGEISPRAQSDSFPELVLSTLQEANRQLIEMARGTVRPRTIGSTVVALSIADGRYRCFWAGDSRAYRIRGREIAQLTIDHSLVRDLVNAGLVKPEDAESHPDANVITRAVGATPSIEIDSVDGDAQQNDIFVLATDGVTRVVSDHDLLTELTTKNPHQAVASVSEMVLARGAPDNFSIIVVRVI